MRPVGFNLTWETQRPSWPGHIFHLYLPGFTGDPVTSLIMGPADKGTFEGNWTGALTGYVVVRSLRYLPTGRYSFHVNHFNNISSPPSGSARNNRALLFGSQAGCDECTSWGCPLVCKSGKPGTLYWQVLSASSQIMQAEPVANSINAISDTVTVAADGATSITFLSGSFNVSSIRPAPPPHPLSRSHPDASISAPRCAPAPIMHPSSLGFRV
jgi:hypothetical protein